MSVVIQHYPGYTDPVIGSEAPRILIHLTSLQSQADFKTLVQRAMNTWPDAPAELKEFADLLLEGKILQDYKSQG